MATVKSSDSKRQIAQPTSNKPPQKSTNKGEVKVVKNGIERTFSRSIWDNLPPGKEGYTEVTGPSQAEIDADNKAKADAQAKIDAENQAKADAQSKAKPVANTQTAQSPTYDEAVKAYTDAYGEAPGQDLTIEEILAKVTAKKQEGK